MGASVKEELSDEITVTVIAAGFGKSDIDHIADDMFPQNEIPKAKVEPRREVRETINLEGTSEFKVPDFLKQAKKIFSIAGFYSRLLFKLQDI